ncbi:MAG TPA: VWA domain-containing protein, partial [Bryobacteraceae bacterium]|nr:VWA domain-containing protein [Bryobacteraceae bacterium]
MPSACHRARFAAGAALTALLTGALVRAQSTPDFRVSTRLVEVDVLVSRKGHPVAGLSKDDFSIFDNGRPQKIAAFRVAGADSRLPESALPPGVVSNRPVSREGESAGITVLLIDRLNTDVGDQAEVRRQLLNYLETAPTGERLALYSLNKSLRVVQDFTADPEVLRSAASSRASAESSFDLTAELFTEDLPVTGDALTDDMIQNGANELKDFAMKNRAAVTVAALEAIAKHLAALGGRKKLVWFTAAFPAQYRWQGRRNGRTQIEDRDFANEIDNAARALNDANIAVYPIDPRNPIDGAFTAPGIDTMNLLAGKTGGRAFYVLDDLEGAMLTVEQDSEITYALSYYPSDDRLDGSYHSISVKVAKPGVRMRYRKGYFASESKPPKERQRKAALDEVFLNPLEATTLGVMAKASVADKPGEYNLDLVLDLHQFHLE